jgi:hypothetical protein
MQYDHNTLLPDDPSLPALRKWLARTAVDLSGGAVAFFFAGWAVGRFVFPHGGLYRFPAGLFAIVLAFVTLHFGAGAGSAWVRRCPHTRPYTTTLGPILGTILLAAAGGSLGAMLAALGHAYDIPARLAFSQTAVFIVWLAVLLNWRRAQRRALPKGIPFRRLFGPGPFEDRRRARLNVAVANQDGVRPGDVDPAVLDHLLIVADGTPPDADDRLYALYAAIGRRDIEAASGLIEQMGGDGTWASGRLRAAAAAETAYFLARYRHEPELARHVLHRFRGAVHDPCAFRRAAAAILLAEGRRPAARALLEELREYFTWRRTKTGVDKFLYDEWSMMLAEASSPASGPPGDMGNADA